ncbi:MAG TPA: tripartite tricarboxylate transporter substrate binding protein [Burkholderiales bacterium]|nr:tripartite tricarboxylate transporter substrate binding protein [Burkholderiales bacterium]
MAQDYPKRPVRMVLSFGAPGGAPDTIARTLAPKLSEMWGQQLVVDPRSGAGGILGTEIVAKAAPDGYTLVLVSPSHAINPALHAKMPYDALRDFSAVTQLAEVPNILSVHPGVPARSVKELIALAKGKPGGLSYGSAGIGSSQHLAGELFKEMAGVNLVHVPYKAASATNVDLIAGRIQLASGSTASVPHIRSGKLVGLAVTTAKRSPAVPDLPTIAEAGLPGYEAASWYGVLVPAGTSLAIIARLHKDFTQAAQMPEVRQQQSALAIEPTVSASPAAFAAFIARERAKWADLVRKSGAKAE